MTFIQKKVYYFEKPGEVNTQDAARFAVERAKELNIRKIVVASTSGKTAEVFFDTMNGSGLELVVVTHVVGFAKPGEWEFSEAVAHRLQKHGVRIVTTTHALSGLERALTRSPKVGGGSRSEAIAEALRRVVAVGLKVAVECVLMAADQGAIGINDEVIAVGGTMSGADTVCVIRPAHTSNFFDLQVREIVAMPRVR
ncbi:MAG: pyruvate kinase alpha/beta domain-containing protein [Methanoregula sp.]